MFKDREANDLEKIFKKRKSFDFSYRITLELSVFKLVFWRFIFF